jgi:DMSO reductase family type II enzyme heme b subunit
MRYSRRTSGFCILLVGLLGSVFLTAPAAADGLQIVARFVEAPQLPVDPHSALWQQVPAVEIPLSSQVVAPPRASSLVGGRSAVRWITARSLHNGKDLAILLEWGDLAADSVIRSTESFRDAAALQFPVKPAAKPGEVPHFAMGDTDMRVNIWHWKAEWQEQGRRSPMEDLVAEGYGTLTTKPAQQVTGRGIWSGGRWKVVFFRSLRTGDDDGTQFAPGGVIPVAFAVWDGGHSEGDGQKSVSTWHALRVE